MKKEFFFFCRHIIPQNELFFKTIIFLKKGVLSIRGEKMKENNMTALVSCFSRAYHYNNNKCRIFSDNMASKILTEEEYNNISFNMKQGINFFNPEFKGTEEEALRWIVDNQLSPSVLGRSSFCEDSLTTAINLGTNQYLIYASGYDTYSYRRKNNINVFEIDKEEVIEDKMKRLNNSNIAINNTNYIKCDFTTTNWINKIINSKYDSKSLSFNSLLGISYYLSKDEFEKMIKEIANIICEGSSVVFDYQTNEEGKEKEINEQLAKKANEEMKAKYTYNEIEKILEENNLYIYEHLNDEEMTNKYFYNYNTLNPNNKMKAPKGINYCLAVKK